VCHTGRYYFTHHHLHNGREDGGSRAAC